MKNKPPLEKETPKHKKRSKKHPPKKSNHKHEYIDVIIKVHYKGSDLYYLGYQCSICGFVSKNMHFFDEEGLLNEERVKKNYKHLDIVEIEW